MFCSKGADEGALCTAGGGEHGGRVQSVLCSRDDCDSRRDTAAGLRNLARSPHQRTADGTLAAAALATCCSTPTTAAHDACWP